MQQQPAKRALALVVALAFAAAAPALAQETTDAGAARFDTTDAAAGAIDTAGADTSVLNRDTSGVNDTSATGGAGDASGVQNPPGYSGMERDTTMFPAEGGPPATPDQAADQTTGTYGDSADAGAEQNPEGYRGMERPVGGDSAAGHDSSTHHPGAAAGDTTAQSPDSAQ